MRIRDAGVHRRVREANAAWLSPWDASSPGGPAQPSLVMRLASVLRQSSAGPYALAIYSRLRARLGLEAYWAIWYDGQFAGQLTVFRIMWGPLRSAEVGYWVDQRLAGRGIVPAALALAVDHCFRVMHLHRVEAGIQPQNTASRRAVQKLGFRDEGLRAGLVHVNGAWQDHICYALTADEVPDGVLARWRMQARARRRSAARGYCEPAAAMPLQPTVAKGSSGSWPGLTAGAAR